MSFLHFTLLYLKVVEIWKAQRQTPKLVVWRMVHILLFCFKFWSVACICQNSAINVELLWQYRVAVCSHNTSDLYWFSHSKIDVLVWRLWDCLCPNLFWTDLCIVIYWKLFDRCFQSLIGQSRKRCDRLQECHDIIGFLPVLSWHMTGQLFFIKTCCYNTVISSKSQSVSTNIWSCHVVSLSCMMAGLLHTQPMAQLPHNFFLQLYVIVEVDLSILRC